MYDKMIRMINKGENENMHYFYNSKVNKFDL